MNSSDFGKLRIFILHSELACLGLGYMDWMGGNIEAEADLLAEFNLVDWWNRMVDAEKFNYFLLGTKSTDCASSQV